MNAEQNSTIGDYFLTAAARWPDADFLIFPDYRHSYATMKSAMLSRAASFKACGIVPGDHVGLLMANCPEYIECLLGLQCLGAIAVPMNARYKPDELAYVVSNAELKLIVTHDLISEYADFGRLLLEAAALSKPEGLEAMVMLGGQREGFMTQADFEAASVNVDESAVLETLRDVSSDDPAIMM